MEDKTIFIILIIVTVGLASVTGILTWFNMQPIEGTIHSVDISNFSTVDDSVDDLVDDSGVGDSNTPSNNYQPKKPIEKDPPKDDWPDNW